VHGERATNAILMKSATNQVTKKNLLFFLGSFFGGRTAKSVLSVEIGTA
jgi:hypothetical protein